MLFLGCGDKHHISAQQEQSRGLLANALQTGGKVLSGQCLFRTLENAEQRITSRHQNVQDVMSVC
jgi:hypothetical protein